MSSFASYIAGIGSAFPKKRVTNVDLSTQIETNDEWIRERTGIVERRISDLTDSNELNSGLGAQAALRAMEMANVNPSELDGILYATCSPDTLVPSTACWLQNRLKAKKAWATDLNAACSGFVYGVSMADQYIKSGHSKTILVVGAEVLHPFVNWQDRTSCILFGDGAGAAILTATDKDAKSRVLSTHLRSDGTLWELFHTPAGGSNMEVTHEVIDKNLHKMIMKGKEIYKVAVKTLAEFAMIAIEYNGLKPTDIDWFVPHQANLRIIEAVAKRLDFPIEKVLINIDRFGNTSAATVPTALDEAVRDGRVKRGQLILMDVFGAGLTYGSALVRW